MNFELSEEQELLQETVRGFFEAECPVTRLREIYDNDEPFDAALWKGLAELGLAGIAIPDTYGGAGLAALDLDLLQPGEDDPLENLAVALVGHYDVAQSV